MNVLALFHFLKDDSKGQAIHSIPRLASASAVVCLFVSILGLDNVDNPWMMFFSVWSTLDRPQQEEFPKDQSDQGAGCFARVPWVTRWPGWSQAPRTCKSSSTNWQLERRGGASQRWRRASPTSRAKNHIGHVQKTTCFEENPWKTLLGTSWNLQSLQKTLEILQ